MRQVLMFMNCKNHPMKKMPQPRQQVFNHPGGLRWIVAYAAAEALKLVGAKPVLSGHDPRELRFFYLMAQEQNENRQEHQQVPGDQNKNRIADDMDLSRRAEEVSRQA